MITQKCDYGNRISSRGQKPQSLFGNYEGHIATVRNQVLLSMLTDFENFSVFKPAPQHEQSVNLVFDQVIAWGGALKTLREK
jgi:hypothetical protein